MKRNIIIDYIEYTLTDDKDYVDDEKIVYQIKDSYGREHFVIGCIGMLSGPMIVKIWTIESEEDISDSIFTGDMVYDDEYFKSTYFPTEEEEEEARKFFEQQQNNL